MYDDISDQVENRPRLSGFQPDMSLQNSIMSYFVSRFKSFPS